MVNETKKSRLYLAGPIEGCEDKEITEWRDNSIRFFSDASDQIITVNPFRAEERAIKFSFTNYFNQTIFDKNWYDCQQCDAILAYLPKEINDRRPSIGTLFEIAWFISMRKPIFIVSDDPVYVLHPLIKTNTGWIYDNFEECYLAILTLLEY